MPTIDPSDLARVVQKELEDYVERSTETVKSSGGRQYAGSRQ